MNLIRSPKVIVPTTLAVLTALFVGTALWRNASTDGPSALSVTALKPSSLAMAVTATGTVEPAGKVEVKSYVSSVVRTMKVEEGDTVKAGDPLAGFSPEAFATQLAQAESAAAQASLRLAQVQRKVATWDQQASAQLAQAEASLTSARAAVAQQQSQAFLSLGDALTNLEVTRQSVEATKVTQDDLDAAKNRLDLAITDRRLTLANDATTTVVRMRVDMEVESAQADYDRLKAKFDAQAAVIASQLAQAQARVDQARAELARMEDPAASPALAQAKQAEAALDLARISAEVGKVGPLDLADAKAAAAAAQAAYLQALADYKSPVVASPAAGRVIVVNVNEGDAVVPGATLFVIGRTDELVVKAKIDEVDIGKVAVGHKAKITSAAYVGQVFEGTVTKLAPRAVRDGNISVFIAEITVRNPDDLLKPGMNVDVEISSSQKDAVLALPLEAVLDRGGEKVVFVLDGSVVHQRKVSTGIMTQTQVEITEGLKEGEKVVTGPSDVLAKLKDGDRVKVQP